MSASVTSDRTKIRKRGTMLAYIFANQGWGSLVGSVVTIVVLSAYKPVMNGEGHTSKVDGGAFHLCSSLRVEDTC
jgi:MFS transporter, PHS family, inorganic phosphate transporter